MSVKEDFAFIIYAATFACWMVAHGVAYLNDDQPPRWVWWFVFLFGMVVYLAFGGTAL